MKKKAKKATKRWRPAKKTIIIDKSPCSIVNLLLQLMGQKDIDYEKTSKESN